MQERSRMKKTKKKNPAAVALGRLGGLKGGPARAKALSPARRSELARRAVMTRWRLKRRSKIDKPSLSTPVLTR